MIKFECSDDTETEKNSNEVTYKLPITYYYWTLSPTAHVIIQFIIIVLLSMALEHIVITNNHNYLLNNDPCGGIHPHVHHWAQVAYEFNYVIFFEYMYIIDVYILF